MYTDIVQCATEATRTIISAKIEKATGKKCNNYAKEGGLGWDKGNKITCFHYWEKLNQIVGIHFRVLNNLGDPGKPRHPKKNNEKNKYECIHLQEHRQLKEAECELCTSMVV